MKRMKTPRWLRRAFAAVVVSLCAVSAHSAPESSSGTSSTGSGAKPHSKPTTQTTLDQALNQLKSDTPITVSEGTTASAIRGSTAAPAPGSSQPFGVIVPRGSLSTDSENPGGEKDPAFIPHRLVLPAGGAARRVLPAGKLYLKDLPNAREIATRAASRLGQQSINIALLGQHKYMIADCLGVKVSVGQFNLQLGSPSISIVDEGVVARYTINRASFSAFKLRFRPDVTDLAQPCHFSGRVELGGSADNLVIELRYNPIIDVEKCRVGEPVHIYMHIDIGSIHLNPLPPGVSGLENAFKDMIIDAINDSLYYAQMIFGGTDPVPLILNQVVQTLDDVLEADCPTKNSNAGAGVSSTATSLASGATSATPPARRAAPPLQPANNGPSAPGLSAPPGPASTFVIVTNTDLKGRLGRMVIAFPGKLKVSDTRIDITKAGSDPKIKTGFGSFTTELMPGNYDVMINGLKVAGVVVESHADTRVCVGVLHLNATEKTRFDLFTPASKSPVKTVYGEATLGLPSGNVDLEVSGQRESLVIADGKVTEY